MSTVTSRSRKPRTRNELSRAELKAYEARRADERKRIGTERANETAVATVAAPVEHTYAISRDDEFAVIKSDLLRLLVILVVILVILAVLTLILR